MREDEAYLEIAQRFIESCEKHIANNINIQEILGFKSYHAFESIAGAFNTHYGNKIPNGHTQKINLFVANSSHNRLVHRQSISVVAMLLTSSRNKYLYPETIAGGLKCPKDQISMTDAKFIVRRVKGILRNIEKII